MTQQIINIGAAINDGTGDPARNAFDKSNQNFTELYTLVRASDPTPPQGRLTLQTGTPVMTTTQAAKTTIFYTPYIGNRVPIYDGTNMVMTTFAELSVATTDTTKNPAAIGANKVNDWFVWSDAGTIRLGHGPDWTSDTVRSTALVMVNGIWLNNAAITNGPAASRGTYVGTTRSEGTSQLLWQFGGVGAASYFRVWNAYNRVSVMASCAEATGSWTYTSASNRFSNGSGVVQHEFVSGLAEDGIYVSFSQRCFPSSSYCIISCGMDTVSGGDESAVGATGSIGISIGLAKAYPPQLGLHNVVGLEAGNGSAATTFYGTPFQQFVLQWRA